MPPRRTSSASLKATRTRRITAARFGCRLSESNPAVWAVAVPGPAGGRAGPFQFYPPKALRGMRVASSPSGVPTPFPVHGSDCPAGCGCRGARAEFPGQALARPSLRAVWAADIPVWRGHTANKEGGGLFNATAPGALGPRRLYACGYRFRRFCGLPAQSSSSSSILACSMIFWAILPGTSS